MWPYVLIVLAFLADRISKWWAAAYLAQHGPTNINSFFALTETYNRGIAFGLFQGIGPLVGWLTIGVVVAMVVYLQRLPKELWLLRLGLSLIIGGALGNLFDRITAGQVLDFIVSPLRPGIFNVADVMINLGMLMALLGAYGQRAPKLALQEQDELLTP